MSDARPGPSAARDVATAAIDRLRRVAAWLRPVARRACAAAMRRAGHALRALGRLALRHRRALSAVVARATWWAALALLAVGCAALVDDAPLPEPAAMLAPFAIGVSLCAGVVVLVDATAVRRAAIAVGSLHAAMVALVLTAIGG